MTIVQQSSNGHCVHPPPILGDELERGILPEPLPVRCQFTFSDGRQCRMPRSDIHSSLCRFHTEREEQLFGDPAPGGNVVGAALDLTELHSACRDLTTATGVNRALAQVFRLLAQRRISRQEAATFGHLAQLLLRSISYARSARESDAAPGIAIPSSGDSHHPPQKGYPQDALFAGNKVELSLINKAQHEPRDLPATPPHPPSQENTQENKTRTLTPPIAPAADSQPPAPQSTVKTPLRMNTGADFARNPNEISTSENAKFKALQNEHLQVCSSGRPAHFRQET